MVDLQTEKTNRASTWFTKRSIVWVLSICIGAEEAYVRRGISRISKATRKPKSKKHLLSNAIIAANWDKSETLAQNYKRLGLTRRLNKNTGGVEKKASDVGAEMIGSGLEIGGTGKTKQLDISEARIERDPSTGRILRVLDETSVKANPLHVESRLRSAVADQLTAAASTNPGLRSSHIPPVQVLLVHELPSLRRAVSSSCGQFPLLSPSPHLHRTSASCIAGSARPTSTW